MKERLQSRVFSLKFIGLTAFGLLLVVRMIVSLSWTMEHDSPLLYYTAFLMKEHGAVPYVDFFETSMPGTFLFHYAIAEWFGFGNPAFRFVDLGVLGTLLLITFVFMRRFGFAPALGACIAFGLIFLSRGPWMSLQREYFALVPIAASLLVIPSRPGAGKWGVRFAVAGFLFGAAAMIKPHLAMGLVVVLAALYIRRRSEGSWKRGERIQCAVLTLMAFCLPVAAAVLWLQIYGAWDEFLSILLNYLPLHTRLSKYHALLPADEYTVYLLSEALEFGKYGPMMMAMLFGAFWGIECVQAGDRRRVALGAIFALCVVYAIYPVLSGQFWDYHYIPLAFFLCLAASLALAGPGANGKAIAGAAQRLSPRSQIMAAAFFLGVFLQANSLKEFLVTVDYFSGGRSMTSEVWSATSGENQRVIEVSNWLKARRHAEDRVQTLDWVKGGGIHALLRAEAPLATRFMYNYHFYHHISSPYIQQLRAEFVQELRRHPPRYIVKYDPRWWAIAGADTSSGFEALDAYLAENYALVKEGEGYSILERLRS